MLHSLRIALIYIVIATERRLDHHHRRLGMVEVGYQGVRHTELVRREYELIGPSLKLLQQAVGTHGTLRSTGGAHADAADTMTSLLRAVHDVASLLMHEHLFRRHLVLRQILHLDRVEVTKSTMQSDIGKVDASDLHTLHELTAEVQTSGGSGNGTLVLGVDGLEALDAQIRACMQG